MTADPIKQIIHLDMDAFYASVEALDAPALKGQPLIVGGLGPRGVVSTASYEARAYGVHSAMPMGLAKRLCPMGVYLKPRPARYQELSQKIMLIFHSYTPLVEPLSLDEAFLDVTGSIKLFGPGPKIAQAIKDRVRGELGLTISAGVASQKHLAKIASGFNKPDGLTVIQPGRELDFLRPLPLKNLWGVGRVMLKKLEDLGLVVIGDLADLEPDFLKRFGQNGRRLWELANGLDPRPVEPWQPPKSVGSEETYAVDLAGAAEIRQALLAMAMLTARRLRRKQLKGRSITVKIRDSAFKTITRVKTLVEATDLRDEIYHTALELYEKEAGQIGRVRLLGVTVSQLSYPWAEVCPPAPVQPGLFDAPIESSQGRRRSEKLNQALDAIADRFGEDMLKPASLMKKSPKPSER